MKRGRTKLEQNKIYPLLALTLILSVLISVGVFTFLTPYFVGPQGEQGLTGLPGEQGPIGKNGLSGNDGVEGKRGPIGSPGKDYIFNGEWVYVDSWEWEGVDSYLDVERIVNVDAEIWRIHIVINSYEYQNQYFALNIFKGPTYENVTGAWGTTSWYGADYLYCYGKGEHLLNIFYEGHDSVIIFVEEYVSSRNSGGTES